MQTTTDALPLGVHEGFPEAEYHADPGFGSGSIKALAESPAAFKASRAFPIEATDAMDFGSAFHMAILEPQRYLETCVVKPEGMSFSTKVGKEWRETIQRNFSADVIWLSAEQEAKIEAMRAGISRIEDAIGLNPFTHEGHSESAHFWMEPRIDRAPVRGKALVDRVLPDLHWLVDVKTCVADLSERSVALNAVKFGWAVQAAWYLRGVRATRGPEWSDAMFAFAVFQTAAPFSVRFCPVPPETLVKADKLIDRALEHYGEVEDAEASGATLRDPYSGVFELRYPEWYLDAHNLN